ncbi:MAG TPA: hypothetical protein VH796_07505 [Nitrososphaeraceae archaeon]|jgi:hypothetical protein
MAELEIKSYTNAKQILDRHNISINEDFPKLANTVNSIEEYGYDPKRLIAELKYAVFRSQKTSARYSHRRIRRTYCESSPGRILVGRQNLCTLKKSTCVQPTSLQIWTKFKPTENVA